MGETINIVIPFQVCTGFYFVTIIHHYLPKVSFPYARSPSSITSGMDNDLKNSHKHLKKVKKKTKTKTPPLFRLKFFVSSIIRPFGEEEKVL